MQVQP